MKTLSELSDIVSTELSIESSAREECGLERDRIETEVSNALSFVSGLVNYGAVDLHTFIAARKRAILCDCENCQKQLEFFEICAHKVANIYLEQGCIIEAIEGSKLFATTSEFKELVIERNEEEKERRIAEMSGDPLKILFSMLMKKYKNRPDDSDTIN